MYSVWITNTIFESRIVSFHCSLIKIWNLFLSAYSGIWPEIPKWEYLLNWTHKKLASVKDINIKKWKQAWKEACSEERATRITLSARMAGREEEQWNQFRQKTIFNKVKIIQWTRLNTDLSERGWHGGVSFSDKCSRGICYFFLHTSGSGTGIEERNPIWK